jgi:3-methyladenine DNA glycosylase AlkD
MAITQKTIEPDAIDIEALATEIDNRLRALGSATTEEVRAVRKEYSKRLAKIRPEYVVNLALRLLDYPTFTHRFVAYEIVAHHRAALASLTLKDLEQFGRGMDHWAAVDTFACYLSGPAWRQRQVTDADIQRWTRSEDRWWRRAALVSTVPLNTNARGGTGDAARTLRLCRMLLEDRDDMVVKAQSWALRELAKRDRTAVVDFIETHQQDLPARVLREVRNKVTTGLKNPKRK